MRAQFTVVGEALVDLVESTGSRGTYTAHPGGSLYNVALTLARLGQPVSLVARTGQDAFGRLLEDKARASGVLFDRWQIVHEPTSLAVASLDAHGKAHYDFYLDNTAGLGWDDSLVEPPGGVLHVGSLASWRPPSAAVIQALQQRAFDSGTTLVSYDPNVRSVLISDPDAVRASIEQCIAASHVVKTSDEDASFLYPDATPAEVARRWSELGASVVIVTHGADGAVLYVDGDEAARRPGQRIVLADTVGAGDSFSGGLLAALAEHDVTTPNALRAALRGPAVEAALDQAILVSAMTCERAGANPPTRQELDERRGLGGSP